MPYLTPEKKTAKELLKKDKILVRLNYKRKKKGCTKTYRKRVVVIEKLSRISTRSVSELDLRKKFSLFLSV